MSGISLETGQLIEMKFLYAHGFASGPGSRKARLFRDLLKPLGIELQIPRLDAGDFPHLTISSQLHVIETALGGEPACLIGSSMGGYLAALYASRHPEVARLVLMAPAFDFARRWREKLQPGLDFEVYHYATETTERVGYGLIEDALLYPPAPSFSQPALIFHGTRDDVVPVTLSREFVRGHPNARLIEFTSDHELLDALDRIGTEAVRFLAQDELSHPRG